jgi:hypothetical protein
MDEDHLALIIVVGAVFVPAAAAAAAAAAASSSVRPVTSAVAVAVVVCSVLGARVRTRHACMLDIRLRDVAPVPGVTARRCWRRARRWRC